MPSAYLLTPRALNDLDDIWKYVAADNMEAANRVELAILASCKALAGHPQLGSKRIEVTTLPVRFWAVPRYPNFIVVYRPETKPLQVIAIIHGKRDIGALLQSSE